MNFTSGEVIDLIKLYRNFECLWNCKCKTYSNTDQKRKAWDRISKKMHRNVPDLKRKMKHLRAAYIMQKRKVDTSRKLGDFHIEPRLFYYEEMSFLDSVIIKRRRDTDDFCEDAMQDNDLQEETRTNMVFIPMASEQSVLEAHNPISLHTASVYTNLQDEETQPQRKRKKIETNMMDSKFDAAVETILKSFEQKEPENIYTTFAKTIELQLQQLPKKEAQETMNDINAMVTKRLNNCY